MDPKITAGEIADYTNVSVQAIHQKIKSLKLHTRKVQNRIILNHNTSRFIINDKPLKTFKIASSVVKGGVGKTTITETLAIRAALYGVKVLCVDVDQQANLTKGFYMDDEAKKRPVMIDLISGKEDVKNSILEVIPGLHLLPSRLDNVTLDGYMMVNRINPTLIFTTILSPIINEYELILFDCPPTLGSSVCAAMLASDLVISLLNPDIYSYEGIEIMKKEIESLQSQFNKNIRWKILLNKFDARTILSNEYIEHVIQHSDLKEKVMTSVIRNCQEFSNVKKRQKTIFDSMRNTTAKEDIDTLTKEILLFIKS